MTKKDYRNRLITEKVLEDKKKGNHTLHKYARILSVTSRNVSVKVTNKQGWSAEDRINLFLEGIIKKDLLR